MTTTITASGATQAANPADSECVYTFSNGAIVALYQHASDTTDSYSVSTDAGATWTSPVAMPSGWPGVRTADCVVQVGDTLHAWRGTGNLLHVELPFTTGANTFGAATVNLQTVGAGLSSDHGLYAAWDGALWHTVTIAPNDLLIGGLTTTQLHFPFAYLLWSMYFNYTGLSDLHIRVVPGTSPTQLMVTASATFRGSTGVWVLPLIADPTLPGYYNNTSYQAELACTASAGSTHTPLYDAAGTLHLIVQDGGSLSEVRRNGTNSYTSKVPIYGSVAGSLSPASAYDSTTNTIIVPFRSNANQPNGELYAVACASGHWGSPSVLMGGSSAGYDNARASHRVTGTVAPAIATAAGAVVYVPLSPSGPPDMPTVIAPTGYVAGLTPTLTATTSNPSPGDPLAGVEWQVQTADGVTTMLDTTLAQSSPNHVYDGAGLSYGVPYRARTRQKDALSASGAGTWSAWSNWVTFTPVHGPVPTILSVTAAGTTSSSSPVTLGSSTLSAHVSYAQADSHLASRARVKAYAADGVTLVDSGAWQLFSPELAAGSTFDTTAVMLHLLNSTTYKLSIEMTDFTTGLSAESAQWTLNTSWIPPPTPTGFTATPVNDSSIVNLAWSIDPSAVQVNLKWKRPKDTDWRVKVLPAGTTSWTAYPTLLHIYTYGVSITNSDGVESLTATATAELGLAFDQWGIVFTDASTGESVACGDIDNWDSTKWSRASDIKGFVAANQTFEDDLIGLIDYEFNSGFEVIIPVQYPAPGGPGGDNGTADRDALEAMFRSRAKLIYRDAHDKTLTVRMTDWNCSSNDDVEWKITMDLRERRPLVNDLVS